MLTVLAWWCGSSVSPPSDLDFISHYPNLHPLRWWKVNEPPCLLFLHSQNIDPFFLPQLIFFFYPDQNLSLNVDGLRFSPFYSPVTSAISQTGPRRVNSPKRYNCHMTAKTNSGLLSVLTCPLMFYCDTCRSVFIV